MSLSPLIKSTKFINKVNYTFNKYETKFIVGNGATSVVIKASLREDENKIFAIKKIKNVFEHTTFAHRAMREIRLLRCLGDH